MKIWISGPITDIPSHNIYAFNRACVALDKAGFVPIIPHTLFSQIQGEHDHAFFMRVCCKVMLECDGLYMLKDWWISDGSLAEAHTARACGLVFLHDPEALRVPSLRDFPKFLRELGK